MENCILHLLPELVVIDETEKNILGKWCYNMATKSIYNPTISTHAKDRELIASESFRNGIAVISRKNFEEQLVEMEKREVKQMAIDKLEDESSYLIDGLDYINGFTKGFHSNKKEFTKEDILKAINMAAVFEMTESNPRPQKKYSDDDIIQSLLPKSYKVSGEVKENMFVISKLEQVK
jgi:hypothetical protein